VPHSGGPENCEPFWDGTDSLESYLQRGGHPLYGEKDIRYRYNSHGYRCPEFDQDAEIRMVSIGCSWVFGAAVPQDATFHECFARRLRLELEASVVNWNLGRSGTSNDGIARILHLATPNLNPDLVLVLFTRLARREYVNAANYEVRYSPAWRPTHPPIVDAWNHLEALSSAFDDQLNFIRNYKWVESLLADRLWLFSMVDPRHAEPVGDHLDRSRQAGAHRVIDWGRDDGHPGPRTHELIGNLFWEKFVETGGIERLRRRLGASA
jgi:hypothetical protein